VQFQFLNRKQPMGFSSAVRIEAMIACQRQCCLCHQRKHTRMVCHHIKQQADGGEDTFENCIPICPDCHAEVNAFNPHHAPGATQYYPSELRRRREDWYALVTRRSENLALNPHQSSQIVPVLCEIEGKADFDYSQYDGLYRFGSGNSEFLTHWSRASDASIHCYRDNTNVAVALAPKGQRITDIREASLLHFSSRVVTAQIQDIVVMENHKNRYAAFQVIKVQDRTRLDSVDRLILRYWILSDGSESFENAT
jgi:HNH endonuclease